MRGLQPKYSFPATGDAQCHDSEHIMETDNGDDIGIVIKLFIAIAMCILLSVTYFGIVIQITCFLLQKL